MEQIFGLWCDLTHFDAVFLVSYSTILQDLEGKTYETHTFTRLQIHDASPTVDGLR
jgi:hypothetical protein